MDEYYERDWPLTIAVILAIAAIICVGSVGIYLVIEQIYLVIEQDRQYEEQYPNPLTCEQITNAMDSYEEYKIIHWKYNNAELTQKWIVAKCFNEEMN